jgi:hypothetical protein
MTRQTNQIKNNNAQIFKKMDSDVSDKEDIFRIAEGIREFLQDFPEYKNAQKYKALKIVIKNFEESLK